MTRGYSNSRQAIRQERNADRLKLRADRLGRQSARQHGVVVSLARMSELRQSIAAGTFPDTIRQIGRIGRVTEAYMVDFAGQELIAVYDRQGQSIASFMHPDALPLARTPLKDETPGLPA